MGEVCHGNMFLLYIGKIVHLCWYEIPIHFNHIKIDEFIVMPDHIHGILKIYHPRASDTARRVATMAEQN